MLNIGRKTYRNLPEQVGFLTKEVSKLWETLDGLDVYDNVIIIDDLDPLSPNELEIVNKPVAFIVYNNTLYMKRGVGVNEAYFDAVFQVSESGGVISFNSSEIIVSYPLGTLSIVNTSTSTYDRASLDTQLGAKLDDADLLDRTYPVGAIYLSVVSTSPASLFGGTWEAIGGKFLLSAGGGYTAGDTGGEATHTLTTSEMPSHKHGLRVQSDSAQVGQSCFVLRENYTYYWESTIDAGDPGVNRMIESTGGDGAHNNMPPYLVVYMWKRTA